jgi:hypothetical protein
MADKKVGGSNSRTDAMDKDHQPKLDHLGAKDSLQICSRSHQAVASLADCNNRKANPD